ncbi:MAG: hypothetical protein ACPIOQ_09545 [Promethearchaeia archaeon]
MPRGHDVSVSRPNQHQVLCRLRNPVLFEKAKAKNSRFLVLTSAIRLRWKSEDQDLVLADHEARTAPPTRLQEPDARRASP